LEYSKRSDPSFTAAHQVAIKRIFSHNQHLLVLSIIPSVECMYEQNAHTYSIYNKALDDKWMKEIRVSD